MFQWTETIASLRDCWKKYQGWAELDAAKEDFLSYWSNFGGFKGVYRSPVVFIAAVITIINYPLLSKGAWSEATVSIVPTVMGFSLTALAIILAIPSTKIFSVLAEFGRKDSYFLGLTAKILHLIVLQTLSLVVALIGRAWDFILINFLGSWLLHYSVLTGALTGLALYGTARMFNHSAKADKAHGVVEDKGK